MVTCRQCATPNTLDSAYCRKCGVLLSPEDVEEARAKVVTLVEGGVHHFNEGRSDEALAVAMDALDAYPTYVPALSLAADVYTRRMDWASALEYADRVVELEPDSDLDRVRRNHLRHKLQESAQPPAGPDRRVALLTAFAAVVLVGSLGALAARMATQPRETTPPVVVNNDLQATDPSLVAQNTAAPDQAQTPSANGADPNAQAAESAPQEAQTPGAAPTTPRIRTQGPSLPLPPYSGGTSLPAPEGTIGVAPLNPAPNGVPSTSRTNPAPPSSRGQDPDPTPQANDAKPAEDPEPDPGEVSITVRKGPAGPRTNPGGSVPREETGGNGVQALLRTAVQLYGSGNLSGAAASYEKALAAGADPVSVNGRLGQVYARLGRNSEAVAAYGRAVQAAQSALATGRGDRDRLQSALDTARQALRTLGGG